MRISKFLSVMFGAVAVCGGLMLACDDDETGTTPGTTSGTDSGTDTGSTTQDGGGGGTDSGGGTDAGTDTGTDAGPPGVTVNVTYAGAKTGSLVIALFNGTNFPPTPPPAKAVTLPAPITFPASTKIEVPAGEYLATVYLDVGSNNPEGAGPEDLRGTPKPVVFAGADVTVDLVITDPDAGDGG